MANDDGSARLVVRRVLIVDDDDDFRALMKTQLSHAGYEVLDARDAEVGDSDRAHRRTRMSSPWIC